MGSTGRTVVWHRDPSGGTNVFTQSRKQLKIAAAVCTLSLVAAACGGSSDTSTDSGSSGASGEILVSGSSTVAPISTRVAELFESVNSSVLVDVDGPGTGDGFALFCDGLTDISDASRPIRDTEAATCAENGIEFTEILVGIDGIGIMTNTNNSAVDCITFEQLFNLIGPNGEGTTTWAEADSSLPDAPLSIFGPGAESGTFDSFVEIVIEDLAEEAGVEPTTRTDYSPSADDSQILGGIQTSDTTLGWVGFAFAEPAPVKLLEVDGGDGCVAATAETIASNEYPISRNLFIYVNNNRAAESEALTEFVDFYVTEGLDVAVAEVGYVPLADDAKEEVRAAWNG